MKIVIEENKKKEPVPDPHGTVKHGGQRLTRPKKRKPPHYHMKKKAEAQARGEEETNTIKVNKDDQHCLIDFNMVFGSVANLLVCKDCKSKINFKIIEQDGLGFIIAMECECPETKEIPSSPYKNQSYVINKRFVFAMKVLGIGLTGCRMFYGLMDMAPLKMSTYTSIMSAVSDAVKKVTQSCLKQVGKAFDFVADVAACQLKEGNKIYLVMLKAIGVGIGVNTAEYVQNADDERAKSMGRKRRKREEKRAANLANEDEPTDEEMPDED